MRTTTRAVSLHNALWSHDRWYRLSWYVGPGSLALLVAGWLSISREPVGPPDPGSWAKSARQSETNSKARSEQEWSTCFTGTARTRVAACSTLIISGKFKGDQLAAIFSQRAFLRQDLESDLALTDYDEALKIRPGSTDALTGRAWLRMARREYSAALDDLNKAIDSSPPASSGVARYYRGYAFLRLENYPKALADLNEAQKYLPNNADVYLARGEVEQAMEDNAAALRDFDEFSRRSPKDTRGLIWRSAVLEATGRTGDALAAMESALALEPANPTVRSERDRLRIKQDEGAAPK